MSPGLTRTDRDYRRAVLAMLAAGLATFNALYATQALLPTLVDDLGITPTEAALTVSATTGMLAVCIVPMSILSERFGRGRLLIISALTATALGLVLPLAPDATTLILLRALQGIAIAGVPAVAMTWLSEELDPAHLGRAMGIYVAGTTVGGLTGRLIPAGLLEIVDWRTSLIASSAVALAMAVVMTVLLPKQRRFEPKKIGPRSEIAAMLGHLGNPRLLGLFIIAFVGMGVFVSLYNFFGFRMIDHFGLSPALVGVVFFMYLSGTWSSARAGAMTDKYGRGRVLIAGAALMLVGLLATMSAWLPGALIGLFLFTASFFAMHSTASSWIGLAATSHRAEASSMYLFSYYAGSSLVGAATGVVFAWTSWSGFILILTAILLGVVVTAAALARAERHAPA
ncbi:MFS transporter, YNFM family, putative membrane transport protein [Corynebacterium pollutisoli]|uniref:MFS transporter, YNFM family, putative membrane transport protein n=1 Tax=Corynebacterium pollutisoli TaxID=1610489 RepID=A0A1X7IZD5_9CORY|nr:MFS transporter [Corynebacterium pollutisoli]SMG19819.1 MFS transporter, YNFM family, putative membrane transport protein [Corynebacterium pollutisoli]